jgi:hypothetical protein
MLDPQIVVNLLPELGVGVDLVRHGNWLIWNVHLSPPPLSSCLQVAWARSMAAKHHWHRFLEIHQATDPFLKKKARIATCRSHSAEEFEF